MFTVYQAPQLDQQIGVSNHLSDITGRKWIERCDCHGAPLGEGGEESYLPHILGPELSWLVAGFASIVCICLAR